jgi:hypothetical protein
VDERREVCEGERSFIILRTVFYLIITDKTRGKGGGRQKVSVL